MLPIDIGYKMITFGIDITNKPTKNLLNNQLPNNYQNESTKYLPWSFR
jgi:hypothetical protein